jgi:hypothetical protein
LAEPQTYEPTYDENIAHLKNRQSKETLGDEGRYNVLDSRNLTCTNRLSSLFSIIPIKDSIVVVALFAFSVLNIIGNFDVLPGFWRTGQR